MANQQSIAQVDPADVSRPCLVGSHGRCQGIVRHMFEDAVCACPVAGCHQDHDEPAEKEDGGLDNYVDLMIERELEDAHFAEGWS